MGRSEYNPTHSDLVRRAARWLRNTKHYGFVIDEWPSGSNTPDVLGYRVGGAITAQIECKVSRSDFLRDAKKPARAIPGRDVGRLRYYMTPPGLVKKAEVPARWGLLYAYARCVRLVKRPTPFNEKNNREELAILYSVLRLATLMGSGQPFVENGSTRKIRAIAEKIVRS